MLRAEEGAFEKNIHEPRDAFAANFGRLCLRKIQKKLAARSDAQLLEDLSLSWMSLERRSKILRNRKLARFAVDAEFNSCYFADVRARHGRGDPKRTVPDSAQPGLDRGTAVSSQPTEATP